MLQGLTCIDGALLFDPLCICHAIGVILDGLTTKGGTPARGARYNSAIRYVGKHRSGVLVVVVSQDGMVDLVPALKPRLVRRSEVEAKIAELQGLQESRCQDVTRLGKVWGWFNERQTYLSPEHCDKVITIWNAILAAVPLPRLSAETGQDAPATWDECFAKEMEQARLRPNPGPPCAPSRDFDEADFIPE